MQFEVTMRDGTSRYIEAAYLEVVEGPMSTSYTMLGPVPGYPTAIVAVFPADLVQAIKPVTPKPYAQRRPAVSRVESRPTADERAPDPEEAIPVPSADDLF